MSADRPENGGALFGGGAAALDAATGAFPKFTGARRVTVGAGTAAGASRSCSLSSSLSPPALLLSSSVATGGLYPNWCSGNAPHVIHSFSPRRGDSGLSYSSGSGRSSPG
eukprot:30108-Pelagococcus_subviridis.AAC.1